MIRCSAHHVLACGLVAMALLSGCSREGPRLVRSLSEQRKVDAAHPASVELHSDGTAAWLIEIDQHELDVWIEVVDANGAIHSATDSPSRRSGPERALLQLPTGDFNIVAHSAEHPKKSASIRIEAYPVSTEQQREHPRWLQASLEETKAARAFRTAETSSAQVALSSYLAAAAEWDRLGDTAREAAAHYQAGWICYRLRDDPVSAAREAERAIGLFQQADDELMSAQSMLLAASAMAEAPATRDRSKAAAAAHARAARDIFERKRDPYGTAEAIHVLASIDHYDGNYARARELFVDAEERFRKLAEPEGVRKSAANAAHMSYELGRFREAVEGYDRIFAADAPQSNPGMYADMLDNSAHARTIIGEFESALQQYAVALDLHRRMNDLGGSARSLFGIGVAYQRIGNATRAAQYLEQTTAMRRELLRGQLSGDRELITDLIALSGAYRELGLKQQARPVLDEALRLAQTLRDRNRVALAIARAHVADLDYVEAAKLLDAIVVDTAGDSAATTLQATLELGRVQTELRDYAAALATLQRARSLFREQGAPIFEAEALYWMAQAYRRRGDHALSLDHTRAAIAIAERIRASATNPDFRSRFLAARRAIYDLQVNLLLDRYNEQQDAGERELILTQALSAADQARARTLSDLIAVGSSDPHATSANRELHRLATDIATREFQLERLREHPAQASPIDSMRRELVDLHAQFDLALSRLPAHESPGAVATTHLPGMPADAAALVYFLSPERSFLWIASAQGLEGIELAGKDSIEAAIAALHRGISRSTLTAASQLLLPRRQALARASTWIVVPDGAIHYVPFAALMVPADASHSNTQFAAEQHSIVLAPTYEAGLSVAHNRDTLMLSPRGPAVIFGDPVYSRADERFAATQRGDRDVVRAPPRLDGAARELERIAVHLREIRPLILSGFDATRESALSEATLRADVIHFAAHATFDARNPARTGIALAAFARDGQHLNNLVTPMDLSAAQMRASLVVLSACESALGEELDGEGPVGLSYGFLAAGSRAVVATQWRVADAATAELMDRFYAHATADKQPLHEALRAAQLDLLRASRWRDPMFWAGTSITATR